MSRAYRIKVSDSVFKVIHVDDGVSAPLDLLPVLPAESMKHILKRVLEDQGFEIEGNIARRTEEDGIVIEIDLDQSEIRLKVEEETKIEAKAAVDVVADPTKKEQARSKAKSELKKKIEGKIERTEKQMQLRVTDKLEGKLRDLREEIDRITNKATAEALKERARQMGEIEELHEDPESGSLTIRVRL
jgi:hypothetical protein